MKKKIIVIEDDPDQQALFEIWMEQLGYEVVGVYSEYRDAAQDLESHAVDVPDIFLIDQHYEGHTHLGTDIIAGFKQARELKDRMYVLKSSVWIGPTERYPADYFLHGPTLEKMAIILSYASHGIEKEINKLE
jgi:CheY-like chemotaxis protein